jgi:hypothetical protein
MRAAGAMWSTPGVPMRPGAASRWPQQGLASELSMDPLEDLRYEDSQPDRWRQGFGPPPRPRRPPRFRRRRWLGAAMTIGLAVLVGIALLVAVALIAQLR